MEPIELGFVYSQFKHWIELMSVCNIRADNAFISIENFSAYFWFTFAMNIQFMEPPMVVYPHRLPHTSQPPSHELYY